MVVVNFLVEFSDRNTVSVPVGISDTRSEKGHPPLSEFIKRLKEKCAIRGPVELRNKDGSKVDFEKWSPTMGSSSFYAIADEVASQVALDYRETMRKTIRLNNSNQNLKKRDGGDHDSFGGGAASSSSGNNTFIKVETTGNATVSDKTGVYVARPTNNKNSNNKSSSASSSRVEVLDDDLKHPDENSAKSKSNTAAAPDEDASDSGDDDEYDPKGGEHLFSPDAIHYISHGEGKGTTSISKVAAEYGHILCQELPELSPMYPSSLVDLIRRDPKLKIWLHLLDKKSKAIEKLPTALPGVDADEYSNLLYIAKRRGHSVPASKDEEAQVSFYPFIDTLTHSCAPSAIVRFKKARNNDPEKHRAILRCISWKGLQAGDLLSIAMAKVNTMDFFLLPTARRRRFIQEQYSLKDECRCARCTGRISVSQSEVEESLTGAFFVPRNKSVSSRQQTHLSAEMKNEFDALRIMAKATSQSLEPLVLSRDAKAGKISNETVTKIYDFLKKYTHELVLPKSQQQQQQQQQQKSQSKTKKQAQDDDVQESTKSETAKNNNEEQEEQEKVQDAEQQQQQQQQQQDQQEEQQPEEKISLKLHPNHWRLSMCRIALLAFLFPPTNDIPKIGSSKSKPENLPTRHPSLKLDQLIVRFTLAQLEVESAALVKNAECAHPALKRSYVVFRLILCCLPEQLSSQVQRDARNLKNVDWPMIEKISNEVALAS